MNADADGWLSAYDGPRFELAFVDCRPGTFRRLDELLGHLTAGGLYVGDDLLPQPTWPEDHQERADAFLSELPQVQRLRAVAMVWASGVVLGARM